MAEARAAEDRYLFPIYHVQACGTCWRSIRRVAAHGLRASARNARKRTKRRAVQKAVALETAGGDGTPPPVELVVILCSNVALESLPEERENGLDPRQLLEQAHAGQGVTSVQHGHRVDDDERAYSRLLDFTLALLTLQDVYKQVLGSDLP